jgi:hypothetical protein
VAVIHAVAADEQGNVVVSPRHLMPQSLDVTLARACDTLVVIVEKVVARDVRGQNVLASGVARPRADDRARAGSMSRLRALDRCLIERQTQAWRVVGVRGWRFGAPPQVE